MKKRLKEIRGAGDVIKIGDAFTMSVPAYYDPIVYKLLSVTHDSEHPEVLTFTFREIDDPKGNGEACAWNRGLLASWTRTFKRRHQTEVDLWWHAYRRPRRTNGWHPINHGLAHGKFLWKLGEVIAISPLSNEVISGKRGGITKYKTKLDDLLYDVGIATGAQLKLGKKLGKNTWAVKQTAVRKPPTVTRG